MLFYSIIVIIFIKPLKTTNIFELAAETKRNTIIKEIVDFIRDIKSCKAEKYSVDRVAHIIKHHILAFKKARAVDIKEQTLIGFISGLSNILLLIASFYMIMNGQMMIATYITFMSLADFFINPVENLVNLQGTIQNGLVSLGRLSDLLDDNSSTNNCTKTDILTLNKQISLTDVNFRYGYRLPVLENLTITIPARSHTLIKGLNGSGKSTLAKIIAGIYEIESGNILLDEIEITINHRNNRN